MSQQIIMAARAAGLVGAGGAGFPSQVKLGARAEIVVANAAECEPLLASDMALVLREADLVVRGLRLAMQATGAREGVIGVKAKHRDAIQALEGAGRGIPGLRLHLLDDYYPAGDEHVLVYETLGRLVPEGGIPLEAGVVVQNVATLAGLARAVDGEPVTWRYVTLTGAVERPATMQLPIGLSLSEALAAAAGPAVSDYEIILGGPMMGRLAGPDEVITKTTGGVIVLPSAHPLAIRHRQGLGAILRQAKSACCQCSACTEVCPRHLLGHDIRPHRIMRTAAYSAAPPFDGITTAFLCSECGLCWHYACPMGLSPARVNQNLKRQLSAGNMKNPHRRGALSPSPWRDGRRVPTDRLISRLGLDSFEGHAPFVQPGLSPNQVSIPLKQHAGASAVAVVKPGDRVKRGDVIGEIPAGALGARVHASIDGVVESVGNRIQIRAG